MERLLPPYAGSARFRDIERRPNTVEYRTSAGLTLTLTLTLVSELYGRVLLGL